MMHKRLYIGFLRDGKWYNHFEIKERIEGGVLATLGGSDKSGPARLLNLVKAGIDRLYTEGGEEYILKDFDYKSLKYDDCWKIAYETTKKLKNVDKIIFPESFFCKQCSRPGMERYTTLEECWDDLVEQGMIDEIYINDPETEIEMKTILPIPISVKQSGAFQGGEFFEVIREPLSIDDMIKITKIPEAMDNEQHMINIYWDFQIKEIVGMNARDFQILVRRNPKDSFCEKYIVDQINIEAMETQIKTGYDAIDRQVTCKNCNCDIGGTLDYSNFFSYLLSKKKSPDEGKLKTE